MSEVKSFGFGKMNVAPIATSEGSFVPLEVVTAGAAVISYLSFMAGQKNMEKAYVATGAPTVAALKQRGQVKSYLGFIKKTNK